MDVRAWLQGLGVVTYAEVFAANVLNGDTRPALPAGLLQRSAGLHQAHDHHGIRQ